MQIRKEQPRCSTPEELLVMLQPFLQNSILKLAEYFLWITGTKQIAHTKAKKKYTYYQFKTLLSSLSQSGGAFYAFACTWAVGGWYYLYTYERTIRLPVFNHDAYSRKIVGFHVSDDMRVTSAIVALQKAIDQKPPDAIVIHHSDRGLQYCSNEYVALLNAHHARISMTQNGTLMKTPWQKEWTVFWNQN